MSAVARIGVHTKLYQALIRAAEPLVPAKLQPLWNHAAGGELIQIYDIEVINIYANIIYKK